AHSHAAAGAKAVDRGGGAAAGHAHGAGMAGMPGMGGAGGDAHHIIIPRTTPEDPAKAKALLAATMQAFGGLTMQNTEGSAQGGPNSSHRKVPDALAKQFAATHPGMPVPKLIVFDTKTGTPIGAFFPGGKDKVPDLGMGTAHRHSADGPAMEHIWFTPDDLQLAFSDVAEKDRAKAAAVAARAGAGGR
ncbi:MAG: hypothetical protein JWM98_2132, partial [Thermoleophilia bacterium]|nr:hypothetical protein [Thermoleophilia bacterium]